MIAKIAGAVVGLGLFVFSVAAIVSMTQMRQTAALPDRPAQFNPRAGAAPLTVVAFGTSLTSQQPWVGELGAVLSACLARPVTVQDIARPGAASDWAVGQLGRVNSLDPDLILVEFAVNDAALDKGLPLARARRNHEAILAGLAGEGGRRQIVLMTTNPVFGVRRLARPLLPSYYGLYAELAEDHNQAFLNLLPRWRAIDGARRRTQDGLHPDPAVAASVIVPGVLSILGLEEDCGVD